MITHSLKKLFPALLISIILMGTLVVEAKNSPIPEAKTTLRAFLTLPLDKKTPIDVGEGWNYSKEEQKIHGYKTHYGVDFEAARGTPVLAAADGWAFSSYHLGYAGEWKGKDVGFGLGNFIQIWHPDQGVFTSYAHLSSVAKAIPYIAPEKTTSKDGVTRYEPKVVYQSIKKTLPKMKFVHRGDIIGYVGDSGLSWGYPEAPAKRPDAKKFPSWDHTHLHFEVYTRGDNGSKAKRYDPFDRYADASKYGELKLGKNSLWLTEKNGKTKYVEKKDQKVKK